MKIYFKKVSNSQHELSILRDDGSSESTLVDTRNFLLHDLTHFAVESEANLQTGFWGLLAAGKTLADLNDRTGKSIQNETADIMTIEAVVGVLHNLTRGSSASEIVTNLRAQGKGLGWKIPTWLSEDFIESVHERLKKLLGHWRSTKFGEVMEFNWK